MPNNCIIIQNKKNSDYIYNIQNNLAKKFPIINPIIKFW